MKLDIYGYSSALTYLQDFYKHLKLTSPASIRSWAMSMGLSSPALLLDILKKKRPIKMKYVKHLAKGMQLKEKEAAYFGTLVLLEYSSGEDKDHYESVLRSLRPRQEPLDPTADVFSHWLNLAVYLLGQIEGYVLTPEAIQRSLNLAVSKEDIIKALNCLEGHQLVKLDESGHYKSCGSEFLTTPNDVSRESSRRYYAQVQTNAQNAIELPLDDREFQCFAIAMKEESIPKIKEIIRKAREDVASFSDFQGSHIYQFNFNAFPIAKTAGPLSLERYTQLSN